MPGKAEPKLVRLVTETYLTSSSKCAGSGRELNVPKYVHRVLLYEPGSADKQFVALGVNKMHAITNFENLAKMRL
jgi:hypothetical protein